MLTVQLVQVGQTLKEVGIKLDVQDISMGYFPLRVIAKNVELILSSESEVVTINRIEISQWTMTDVLDIQSGKKNWTDLNHLRLSAFQLKLPDSFISSRLSKVLKELGYDKLVLNAVSEFDFDRVKKVFKQKEFSLEAVNMGKVNLEFELENFDLIETIASNSFNQSSVQYFSLSYKDYSLIRQGLAPILKQNEIQKKYLSLFKIDSKRDPASENSWQKKIEEGIQNFIEDPNEISITLTPKESVPFKDLSLMLMLSPSKAIENFKPIVQINNTKIKIIPDDL